MIWMHTYTVEGAYQRWELAADNDRGCPCSRACMHFISLGEAQLLLRWSAAQERLHG